MDEKTVTDQVIDDDNKSDVVVDDSVENEVIDGEDKVDPDGETVPEKADANIAKSEFKLRGEKRKRIAAETELADLKAQNVQPDEDKPVMPLSENFDGGDAYNIELEKYYESLTDWKLNQRDATNKVKTQQSKYYESLRELDADYQEQCETAMDKYEDFADVEGETKKHFDPVITEAVLKSKNSAEVVYYIGTHPEILDTLRGSSPVDVVRKINDIESKLKQTNKNIVTTAPNPINPIVNGEDVIEKDPSKMSIDEWMKRDKAESLKKLKTKMETGLMP